jgi:sulfotransferase
MLDILKTLRSNFSSNMTFRAQDRISIYENFRQGMKGFVEGYFYDSEVVFDKNRNWPANLKLIDTVLGNEDTKVIYCYRDPVEIVCSIEAQYQKTFLLENMDESAAPGAFSTLERRISTYTAPEGLIGFPIECLKDALEMGYGDRILFVKYFDLTNSPKETLEMIHDFLGEEKYEYDFKNIQQSTFEFDGIYNYKFPHVIKQGEIKYKRADMMLEPKYVAAINERYLALNKLIFEGDANMLLNLPPNEQQPQQDQAPQPSQEEKGLFQRLVEEE